MCVSSLEVHAAKLGCARSGFSLCKRVPQSMPYDMCMYIQRNGFLKSSNEQHTEHTL